MKKARVLVLAGYGLNCDYETEYAFELAGAEAKRVHINSLIRREVSLHDFHILVFVGGFSWGDDHGAGVLQAVRLKANIGDELLRFVQDGRLILGICNGFQALVNTGLLPGFDGDYSTRSVALTANDSGNFRDDWVHLRANAQSPCVFTRGISGLDLPIRHGEGKFYAAGPVIQKLLKNQQVALTYAMEDGTPAMGRHPENPNGSVADIAGICDPTGRVFGLMPHPEAYSHPTNHPLWTRAKQSLKRQGKTMPEGLPPGVRILENAVKEAEKTIL